MFPDITLICVGHRKLEVLVSEESCFLLFIKGVFVLFIKQQEVWRRYTEGETPECTILQHEQQETFEITKIKNEPNPTFSHT